MNATVPGIARSYCNVKGAVAELNLRFGTVLVTHSKTGRVLMQFVGMRKTAQDIWYLLTLHYAPDVAKRFFCVNARQYAVAAEAQIAKTVLALESGS